MSRRSTPTALLLVTTLAVLLTFILATLSLAADHREAPLFSLDTRADINDIFIFQDPLSNEESIFVTTQFGDFQFGNIDTQFNVFDRRVENPLFDPSIQINPSSTTSNSFEPRIAVDPLTGHTTVTYVEFPTGFAPPNTFRSVFDPSGNTILGPTQLNTPGTVSTRPGALDAAPNGGIFAVVPEINTTSFETDFVLRLYDANGNVLASPTPLGITDALLSEARADVVATHSGALVAATGNNTPGTALSEILIVHKDFRTPALPETVKANETSALSVDSIDLARPNTPQNGDQYYVTWDERDTTGKPVSMRNTITVTDTGITAGTPVELGGGLLNAENPKVTVSKNGTFTFTYQAQNPLSTAFDNDIFAEQFAPNGTPIGGPFQVNSFAAGNQTNPDVDDLPSDGTFIFAFTTNNTTLSPTGENIIAAIDLPAPTNLTPNTIIADDFGTPWTDLPITGATATHNDGPTDSNNFADIVVDPDNPDSADGVLHFKFDSGAVMVESQRRNPLPAAVIDNLMKNVPFDMVVSGRVRVDDNALANDAQLGLGVQFFDFSDPNNPVLIDTELGGTINLQEDFEVIQTWASFERPISLGALLLDSRVTVEDLEAVGLNYKLIAKSAGDPEIWLDNLRITLVPVPEPGMATLMLMALTLQFAQRRHRLAGHTK